MCKQTDRQRQREGEWYLSASAALNKRHRKQSVITSDAIRNRMTTKRAKEIIASALLVPIKMFSSNWLLAQRTKWSKGNVKLLRKLVTDIDYFDFTCCVYLGVMLLLGTTKQDAMSKAEVASSSCIYHLWLLKHFFNLQRVFVNVAPISRLFSESSWW